MDATIAPVPEAPRPDGRLESSGGGAIDELSPFTGADRTYWEDTADILLTGVQSYASRNGALYRLPGPVSASGSHLDGLEGFARPFLLAAYRIRGAGGRDVAHLIDRYGRGLCAGASARGRRGWPSHSDCSQSIVEAAGIALGLFESRPWVWDRLDRSDQRAIAAWLFDAGNRDVWCNNWLLFPVVIHEFLRSVGQRHSAERITRSLTIVDLMYIGNGWYSDGFGRHFDYYCGWAMAFYTAMWAVMGGREHDPGRAERYANRLGEFVAEYQYLFASDGSPVYFGRSLTYRMATCAPLWLAARLGVSSVPMGTLRRISSACLRQFLNRGAVDPVSHLLTVGWHGAASEVAQRYSGPASPYWAAKGFCGLAIDSAHPVWTEPECPAPIDGGDFERALSVPGWLVQGTHRDGIVRLYNHGSDHFPWEHGATADAHYRKLAYSTATAPDVEDAADADAQVVFREPDGSRGFRRRFHGSEASDHCARSTHYPLEVVEGRRQWAVLPAALGRASVVPPLAPGIQVSRRRPWLRVVPAMQKWDVRIDTVSVARLGVEARLVRCVTPLSAVLELGGYAVADDEPPVGESTARSAIARNKRGLESAIAAVRGDCSASITRRQRSNPFGAHSATPMLEFDAGVGETIIVAVVALSATVERALDPIPLTDCAVVDGDVVLTWASGAEDVVRF
jgi:hypothetical protein